jgi:hypothetical protein
MEEIHEKWVNEEKTSRKNNKRKAREIQKMKEI